MIWEIIEFALTTIGVIILMEIAESHLDLKKAKSLVKQKSSEIKLSSSITEAIVEEIETGNVHVVTLGLMEKHRKRAELKIKAQKIPSGIQKGIKIKIS